MIDKTIAMIDALPLGDVVLESAWSSSTPIYKSTGLNSEQLQHLAAELKQLREFVGAMESRVKRVQFKGGCEIVPRFDQWAVFDESGSINSHYATFRKAFDAWQKLRGESK